MSGTINSTLVAWLCEYNGLEPCQVYRVIKRDEDLKAASEADTNVAGMGFKMTLEGVRAKYGEHWEETAPAEVKPLKPASFAESNPAASQPDALDQLIDAEQAQWQAVMEPMVAPIRQLLVARATHGLTAAELLALLPGLLAEMDADPLAESLTRTAFAARLGAQAGIENE